MDKRRETFFARRFRMKVPEPLEIRPRLDFSIEESSEEDGGES